MTDTAERGRAADRQQRLSPDEFRDVIGCFASGVTIITAQHDGRPHGATASAVSSLSLDPPMLLVCLNKASSTGRAVAAARFFAVTILGEDQLDMALRFAGKGDKFAGLQVARGAAGAPLLRGALANLECRVVEEVTGGTHKVFLAEVEHATRRPGPPLAYFRGQFGRLELAKDEEALRELRTRLVTRELAAGGRLNLDNIAESLCVPRSAVYHALTKLSADGLVHRAPDGQFVVTPLTLEVVTDSLEAQRAIQLGVAARTVGRITDEQLVRFREVVQATRPVTVEGTAFDMRAHLQTHAIFHETFVGLAGSRALLDAHNRVNAVRLIINLTSMRTFAPSISVAAGKGAFLHHLAMLEAYEARDVEGAVAAINQHFNEAIGLAQQQIDTTGGEL